MHAYILQTNGSASGDRLFHTKAAAMAAFDRAFSFGGSVTLQQGAFSRDPSHGFVRQHGRAFLIARRDFDDDGQAI